MHEIIVNLHMHTRYSDGSGTHKDIAHAAMKTGVDVVIVTDHTVLVQGVEGYYRIHPRRVLLLVGEEIHDQDRDPGSLELPDRAPWRQRDDRNVVPGVVHPGDE